MSALQADSKSVRIMGKTKSSAAWPVGSLFAAIILLFLAISSHAPDWVAFVIFFGWWVGFYLWAKYFAR
jgi:hypothetical protein